MVLFDSIEQIWVESGKDYQVTAQAVINRRMHVFGEWQTIDLTEKCEDEFISAILDTLGGWTKNQPRMARKLRIGRPQHWGLDRILLAKYGDSPAYFSYCAGQDYSYELKQIRQYLNR